ncbi:N/A [soil metagenome]
MTGASPRSPLFSIIVPTYDRADLLTEALASIQAQSVEDFECIVVDDGSGTAGSVLPADARFRCIALDENGGEARARNRGLDAAVGVWVCFLDDDDRYTANRLQAVLDDTGTAQIKVCATAWLVPDPPVGAVRTLEGDVSASILDSFTPQLGSVAVRRSDVLRFDERYPASGDVEWWLRSAQTSSVSSSEVVGLLVRRHARMRNGNGLEARVTGDVLLFEHHGGYLDAHRRARAFRYYRRGWMLSELGHRSLGFRFLARSFLTRPSARAARAAAGVAVSGSPGRRP